MGKKKVLSEKNLRQMLYPSDNYVIIACSPWCYQSNDRGESFHRCTQNQVDDLPQKDILFID